jgi:DNA polymerase-4
MLASLWAKWPGRQAVPLRVSVTLVKLSNERDRTLSLFGDSRSRDRLNAAIDKLNLRYEKNTVYFGGAQLGLKSAPMRIAFNHIPDLRIESDE